MLLGNDILRPEAISIDVASKSALVDSTDATIVLKTRSAKNAVQRPVHLRKTAIVPPHTEIAVSVNHLSLPASRDFLFEPDNDLDISMYAHMVDASTSAVIVRNDKSVPVMIPRNFRLGRISEIDFPNAFHIDETNEDVRDLALKQPKATHKDDWFKKLISACATAYAAAAAVGSATAVASSSTSSLAIPSVATIPSAAGTPIPDLRKPSAARKPFASAPEADTGNPSPDPPVPAEITMPNEITIYNSETADSFARIVQDFPAL